MTQPIFEIVDAWIADGMRYTKVVYHLPSGDEEGVNCWNIAEADEDIVATYKHVYKQRVEANMLLTVSPSGLMNKKVYSTSIVG